jgi:hypothetical protein
MAVFHSTNLMVLIVAIFEEIALRNSLSLREQIYFLRYVVSILLYKSGDLSKYGYPKEHFREPKRTLWLSLSRFIINFKHYGHVFMISS